MYQQITIVGNVGRDPDLRFTPQGIAVCDFSVAVNKRIGGKDNTEPRDETTWFRITCWRQLAEVVDTYVKKGNRIMIVGEVSASAYIDKSGQPAATLEIAAQTVKFLGSRDDNEASSNNAASGQRKGNHNQQPPAEDTSDIPF